VSTCVAPRIALTAMPPPPMSQKSLSSLVGKPI
jgi:hypothetical protein